MTAIERLQNIMDRLEFNQHFPTKVSFKIINESYPDFRLFHISKSEIPVLITFPAKEVKTGEDRLISQVIAFQKSDLENENCDDKAFVFDFLQMVIAMFAHEVQENMNFDSEIIYNPHTFELYTVKMTLGRNCLILISESAAIVR